MPLKIVRLHPKQHPSKYTWGADMTEATGKQISSGIENSPGQGLGQIMAEGMLKQVCH
jgi:hypothetical protein